MDEGIAELIKSEIITGLSYSDIERIRKDIIDYYLLQKRTEATELMVRVIKENNFIYTTRNDIKSEIWIYRDGIYIPQGKTYIKEICRILTGVAFTPQLTNQVIAKIEADTYIDEQKFFNNVIVNEIPVQNGILNIYTRELNPFDPKKIFFTKLPIYYNKEKDCPKIKQFFKDIIKNEEDINVIQELFGTTLEKEYRLEKAFMFIGSGRNGKGKAIELIKRFLGIENSCSIPIQELQNDSFRLSELHNKLVNLGADIDYKSLKYTGSFKELTGRDMISAKRKFLPDINFTSFAKQIFCANELPLTYDLSPAFFSRWIILEFPYTFKTKEEIERAEDKTNLKVIDPEIIEHIISEEELSGLLNWALDGLDRTIKNKGFGYSKNTDEVKNLWIRKSDSFNGFLLDCIDYDWDSFMSKKELRVLYSNYCRYFKLKPSNDKRIKDILSLQGVAEDREMINDRQEYVWNGLKIKDFSQGSQNSRVFYAIYEKSNLDIREKNPPNLTSLTKIDTFQLEVKEEKVE